MARRRKHIFSWLMRCLALLLAGALATVLVTWALALWSPVKANFDPMSDPLGAPETVDPDGSGERGLYLTETAPGYVYMFKRGSRFTPASSLVPVFWCGPWGGIYHRFAGWPFYALRSRVEVVDSQGGYSTYEDDPDPPGFPPAQRRRWAPPRNEIFHRGVASQDFPKWMHVQPDRRLPLVPIPAGFAADTLIFSAVLLLLGQCWRSVMSRLRRQPRGFPVVTSPRNDDSAPTMADGT